MGQYNVSEAPYVFVFQYAKPKDCVKSDKNCSLLWSFLYETKQSDPSYFLYRIASYIRTTPLPQNRRYITLPSVGTKDSCSLGSANCLREKERIPN